MKKLLQIVPYPIFPPTNGGMLRNYYLCLELSRYFNLTLLILQDKNDFVKKKGSFEWSNSIHVIFPPLLKEGFPNNYINAIKGRYYQKNWMNSAGSFTLRCYPVLRQLIKEEMFEVVLFEHLGYESVLPLVKRYLPNALKIVDMHNVDHLLFAQENNISINGNRKKFNNIKEAESNLKKVADIFFACSEKDKAILEKLNQNRIKGFAIPNGADTNRCAFDTNKKIEAKTILFCGSLDYEPNIEGLHWFYNKVWPIVLQKMPDAKLTIIGRNPSVENFENLRKDDQINFIGQVDDVASFYKANNICIAPLLTGSGTRLKILEAMSFGNAVVSTTIGAEGIETVEGENIMLADADEDFANAITKLFQQPALINRLRNNARLLVEEGYSWNGIGQLAAEKIKEELDIEAKTFKQS